MKSNFDAWWEENTYVPNDIYTKSYKELVKLSWDYQQSIIDEKQKRIERLEEALSKYAKGNVPHSKDFTKKLSVNTKWIDLSEGTVAREALKE